MSVPERSDICTTADVSSVLCDVDFGYDPYNWSGVQVLIRPLIELEEMVELVNDIMQTCVDSKTQIFMPEMMDFALRVHILISYTNVELPQAVHEQYRLVYGTSLYDDVTEVINKGQVQAIKECLELFATTAQLRKG